MGFVEGLVLGLIVGVLVGAWLWNKYKAKAAADLASVAKNVGSPPPGK